MARSAFLLIALLGASEVHAQAPPAPRPPKPAQKKPAPPRAKAKPPAPPAKTHPEDEAIVRDLELYMLFEMLNDYELFYDDDETRQTTPKTR